MPLSSRKIVKKVMTRVVDGLNRHCLVDEIFECPTHSDSFKTGKCASPCCVECRKLLKKYSKQRPRSTRNFKMETGRKVPKEIKNHTANLGAVMQAVNS